MLAIDIYSKFSYFFPIELKIFWFLTKGFFIIVLQKSFMYEKNLENLWTCLYVHLKGTVSRDGYFLKISSKQFYKYYPFMRRWFQGLSKLFTAVYNALKHLANFQHAYWNHPQNSILCAWLVDVFVFLVKPFIILVMRLLNPDVLKVFLAMRRDDGIKDSQPSNKNLRYFFAFVTRLQKFGIL